MSVGTYFVCAVKQVKNEQGDVISNSFHDLIVEGPWAIKAGYDYDKLKQQVAEKLRVKINEIILINLNLLHRSI